MQESRWSMLLTLLSNPQSRSIWCRGFLEARWDTLSLSHTRPIGGNLLKFWIFKILAVNIYKQTTQTECLKKTASMLQAFAQKELKCKTEGMQRFCKLVRLMQCCHLDFAQRLGLSEEHLIVGCQGNQTECCLAVLPKLWQRPMSCATPGNSGFSIEPGPCAMANVNRLRPDVAKTPETF